MVQYVPSGPKFTMAPRAVEEMDKMQVPGPGTYEAGNLDKSRVSLPAFTMAPKTNLPTDRTQKPAPNAYSPEKSESVGGVRESKGLEGYETDKQAL